MVYSSNGFMTTITKMCTFSCLWFSIMILACHHVKAYQQGFAAMTMSRLDTGKYLSSTNTISSCFMPRRSFISAATASTGAMLVINGSVAQAATPPIQTTSGLGVKYAITEDVPTGSPKRKPQRGDIVAIEYTGFTSDGTAFDRQHDKNNKALVIKLGDSGVMLDAVQDVVSEMYVGQKAQAIIPPELGFGDKGLCGQEMGKEICIVPPKATLVYEIYLKKATIPPP